MTKTVRLFNDSEILRWSVIFGQAISGLSRGSVCLLSGEGISGVHQPYNLENWGGEVTFEVSKSLLGCTPRAELWQCIRLAFRHE